MIIYIFPQRQDEEEMLLEPSVGAEPMAGGKVFKVSFAKGAKMVPLMLVSYSGLC